MTFMLIKKDNQLSIHSLLYNKIPENHILKLINSAISFEFVTKLVESSYCKTFGRPAKDPEMMVRILILQHLYNLSDERVIEELQVNLAYMWFIGINPEDKLPEASLLSKFRTMRLSETSLNEILVELVRQCIEKGIISAENGIAIDSTHISANTTKKIPERIMKQLAKKIFKAEGIEDYEIPDFESIENHNEAKQVMKDFVIEAIENATDKSEAEVQEAKEVLESPLFIEQKGIRSLVDKDARVGKKSHSEYFYGYKAEYCMTTEEGIITSVAVNNGAYVDGNDFKKLYNLTTSSGIDVKELFGDKAYFRKDILEALKENEVETYIPVNISSYRVNEELFSYNKDSDQWFCLAGNETYNKKSSIVKKHGKDYKVLRYYFNKEKCRNCPYRQKCLGSTKSVGKVFQISTNTPKYYEYSQRAKQPEFLEKYKKRAYIERKNGEMKRFHGLARARGYGLRSVLFQTIFTAIAVNLKRIAKLISSLDTTNIALIYNLQLVVLKFQSTWIFGLGFTLKSA